MTPSLDGKAGFDSYAGGKGNDTYIVDFLGETVTENAGEGIDTVKVSPTFYTLGANVENLTFTSTKGAQGFGNELANQITGGSGNDTLQGGDGNDTLDGGAGIDKLTGGLDNDAYTIDNANDVIQEFGGGAGGVDTILGKISIDLNLANYASVENVKLIGAGNLNATGTADANDLIGNAGANKLVGNGGDDTLEGGAGADTLDGGTGLNHLIGGAGNDRVNVGGGDDTVFYNSKLDGKDIIDNFDGDKSVGGQDVLNLDILFDSLGVADGDRAGRVSIVDNGASVEVRVNADGNAANGFELAVATLNTPDVVTVGEDVVVGSL